MARTSGRGAADDRLVGELVTSPQRREVVRHLIDSDGAATFDDVVSVLTGEEERTMTAVRLHHVHLPKLESAGAVEWDEETEVIELTSRARVAVDSVTGMEPFGDLVEN
ncbi:hypothetical protein C2R22_01445 [Salinigranum rubrum]|uniref:DUF7344 domain-containing protein n=1 Tax=Salinigranum rubrum TaxID=755307 RepID=A0A2I8VEZ6_9EURY|nr:hypothetical protein [Salinigranum rubrum]AUV80485.1 hypothetical protein C2R22_01445 [Salinigranum rubrum]